MKDTRDKGKLYIVGTPIGNLGDITLRALETLKNVDVIACEDTRHTLGLLSHFGIRKPLISYYRPKEREGAARIMSALSRGDSVALVSDAGMPCISDPGAHLVATAKREGIEVVSVPGPTAAATAFALSGITDPVFVFIGFLPPKKKDAAAVLNKFAASGSAMILYSSPYSINEDAKTLRAVLPGRKVSVVRELTKIYESVEEFDVEDLGIDEPKGEYVLVVHPGETVKDTVFSDPREEVAALMAGGMSKKDAIKKAAKDRGLPKDDIYKLFTREDGE